MNKAITKDQIKIDLSNKKIKGIGWLQKRYKISFKIAKEIYLKMR